MLPAKGWASYESDLRSAGELRRTTIDGGEFLTELGLFSDGRLTDLGQAYFDATFVYRDSARSGEVLLEILRNYPPAAALCQVLYGVASINRQVVETVLRSQGFGAGLSDRSIGSLLALMGRAGMMSYSKATGEIRVTFQPAEHSVPRAVFVSPRTPFSNKVWLRRVLEECTGHIYWLDKHFLPVAFEAAAEAADGTRIDTIKILSLRLPDNDTSRIRRLYLDLSEELKQRGIGFEWRVIDSKDIRDTHDRWIIGATTARNVPNVNAIYSGQNSELIATDLRTGLESMFEEYWRKSVPMFA